MSARIMLLWYLCLFPLNVCSNEPVCSYMTVPSKYQNIATGPCTGPQCANGFFVGDGEGPAQIRVSVDSMRKEPTQMVNKAEPFMVKMGTQELPTVTVILGKMIHRSSGPSG
ncbi:hypothetical protein FIBSPDRAFT_885814 [Athelia psychrophila]|uniref:Uncharacterized protein n=1 Tax=Athelia psychrophila TaxID=1759441 RepID=A0A166RFJ7_9AGAM|nr:hypothetical protein FIBSPDRAFT_885814 [Fibularhizoctonia sp. CBS 109695]